MAFLHIHVPFLLAFLIFIPLPLVHSSKEMTISIHDLLMSKGLPPGLAPKDVKSYTLSRDGLLEVFLEGPCLTKFDTMALYESTVRANLTYGGLIDVEGFSQEELFLWLPVKDIIVDDPKSGIILFDIGVAQKQFSLSLFEDPPDCKQDVQTCEHMGQVLHRKVTLGAHYDTSIQSLTQARSWRTGQRKEEEEAFKL